MRYSGVVPLGGESITSDLAVGLRTSRDEAERIKLHHGCASAGIFLMMRLLKLKIWDFPLCRR